MEVNGEHLPQNDSKFRKSKMESVVGLFQGVAEFSTCFHLPSWRRFFVENRGEKCFQKERV